MTSSSLESNEKDFFEDRLDEESVILTLVPVNEESNEEHQMEPSISSTSDAKLKTHRTNSTVYSPQMNEQFKACPKPIFPLPTVLPSINKVHRDTLRNWCQQINLSTEGKKLEIYTRLREHAYSEVSEEYGNSEESIAGTPQKATWHQCSMKCKMMTKRTRSEKSYKMRRRQERTTNVVEVVTSAQEAMLASWSRIAVRATLPKAVNSCVFPFPAENFLPQTSGVRWCVVHGRPLLADKEGWVRLEFHGAHSWVPDTPKKMVALLLLPACTFPSSDLEDNMLCPECVKRNKKMLEKLSKMKRKKKPHLNIPS